MKGAPTRMWTCDKCGATTSAMADSGPAGWHHVSAIVIPEVRKATDPQFAADWCGTCTAVYLPPLDRERVSPPEVSS
jgi:hypothetical protein